MLRVFEPFDDPVGRERSHAQSLTDFANGLVVRRVDGELERGKHARKVRPFLDDHIVMPAILGLARVANLGLVLCVDVLDERTARGDVHDLHAEADAEHRDLMFACGFGERKVVCLAARVHRLDLGMALLAVNRGIAVIAAGEEEPVELAHELLGILGLRGNENRNRIRAAHGLDVGEIHVRLFAPAFQTLDVGSDSDDGLDQIPLLFQFTLCEIEARHESVLRRDSEAPKEKFNLMTHSPTRIAALLFAILTLAPALHASTPAGNRIELNALPSYVDRVFMPVVPQAENTLKIGALAAEKVIRTPKGFDVRVRNGAVVAQAKDRDAAGYAKVRMGGRTITITLVTVVPYSKLRNGKLDGYRVGEYNAVPLKGLAQYERPKGFIRLSDRNDDLWLSDHYRMRDFQCKLDGTTKYLIVRTDALVKLEILQHELETRHGLRFDKFTIMSGYRTPYYNAKVGNETSYSRHLYGDAMDVYIDRDRNGKMDDVNRDGRIDTADARFLLRVAEKIDESEEWGWLKGGAGVYHANAAHGPYIHVDARGYVARWGATEEPASGTAGGRTVAARR